MTHAERTIYFKLKRTKEAYAAVLGYSDQQMSTFVERGFLTFRTGSWSLKRIYRLARE